MPKAKFFYGTKAQLDAKQIENGGLYMTTDENKWYVDMDGTRHQLTTEGVDSFSKISVGGTLISADSPEDTLTLTAGNNVTLTPNAGSSSITITAKDTTYSNATSSTDGLMSSEDKDKLDNINVAANWFMEPDPGVLYYVGDYANYTIKITFKTSSNSEIATMALSQNYKVSIDAYQYDAYSGVDFVPSSLTPDAIITANEEISDGSEVELQIPYQNISYDTNGIIIKAVLKDSGDNFIGNIPSIVIPVLQDFEITSSRRETSDSLKYTGNFYRHKNTSQSDSYLIDKYIFEIPVVGESGSFGLMTTEQADKLDGIQAGANNYSLPLATDSVRGGVKTGYATNNTNRNYAVDVDSSEKMFVNVPWVDSTSDINRIDSDIAGLQQQIEDMGDISSGDISSLTQQITNLQTGKQDKITGAATTIVSNNLTANRALVSDASGKVAVSAVTSTELGYLDGVTSNIQTQLNNKAAASHNHVSTNITGDANSVAVFDTNGTLCGSSSITTGELDMLNGVTSNIQTQLNNKAAADHDHDASDITSGTLAAARIPNLDAGKITSGTFAAARIPGLDASKITSGTISIDRLPQAALERLVIVADDTARFKLTTSQVQNGDVVKVTSSGKMYYVKDQNELDNANGYEEFAAGTAASVSWNNITGKPSTFTPSTHTHPYAGSASAGGPANSVANALTISLNGTSQGAYNGSAAKSINVTPASIGAATSGHTHNAATTSAAGFMSAADKAKLDGISTSADANQNAFSNVAVGSTTIAADTTTDTLTLVAGSNVTITPDAATDKITIAATDTKYSNATTGTSGLMSATDKAKLDGITASADSVSFSRSLTSGTKVGTITINGTATDLYAPTNTDTTYSDMKGATASVAGTRGLVPAPSAGQQTRFLKGDGTWAVPPDTDTTYSAGTGITLRDTTFSLASSGVTAGSYGPTANVTGTNGTTINVPQITVDAYGRVTNVMNRTYTSRDTNTTYTLSSFGVTATATELNKLDGATVTVTEINYLDGVTSRIQTQLNGKAALSHKHDAGDIISGTLADARIPDLDASKIASGTLPPARGGTGIIASPSMLVNLSSTSAANVFAINPRPGITGTLAISHGGTGGTTVAAAHTNLKMNRTTVGSGTPTSTDATAGDIYIDLSSGTVYRWT